MDSDDEDGQSYSDVSDNEVYYPEEDNNNNENNIDTENEDFP